MSRLRFMVACAAAIPALATASTGSVAAVVIPPSVQMDKVLNRIAFQPLQDRVPSAGPSIFKVQGMTAMKPPPAAAPGSPPPMAVTDDKMGKPMGMGMMPMAPAAGGMPGPGMGKMDDKMAPSATPGMPAAGMPMPPGGLPGPAGRMTGAGMPMAAVPQGVADPLDHIEGRIAYMRAELGVTDAQAPAWDQFAQSLRTGRLHLVEARDALSASASQPDPLARLTAYESHMSMRLDAMRTTRESFGRLNAMLDDKQKQAAGEMVLPVLLTF